MILRFLTFFININILLTMKCYGQTTPDIQSPILLLMGGNISCEKSLYLTNFHVMTFYKKGFDLAKTVNKYSGESSPWIISCFTSYGKLYYRTSDYPERFIETTPLDYITAVDEFWDQFPEKKAVVIGHSYGGWLAMKTVQHLSNNRKFYTVFTIDPISRKNCKLSNLLNNCNSAPSDFTSNDLMKIKSSTNYWGNFYSIATTFPRSSNISTADSNIPSKLSHQTIDEDLSTWTTIRFHSFNKIYGR